MGGFSFGMPRSKAGALQYQKDLKAELMAIRVKEMTDSATPADLERAKKIVRYFTEIGKPIMKATDLEPIPVEDGGGIAYVKTRVYADEFNPPDFDFSTSGRWLDVGTELQAVNQSDKGVIFKGPGGKQYHIDFYDCDHCLAKRKPARDAAPHKFELMPGNRRGMPCNKCLERRSHANHSPDAIKDYEASKKIEARNLAPAKDATYRARLHRALDAVMDSHRTARDSTWKELIQKHFKLSDEQFYKMSGAELDKLAAQLQMAGIAARPAKSNGKSSGLYHPFTR